MAAPQFHRAAEEREIVPMLLSLIVQAACIPGELDNSLLQEPALENIQRFFYLAFKHGTSTLTGPSDSWYACQYCTRWVLFHAGILPMYVERVKDPNVVVTCGASGYGSMCDMLHNSRTEQQRANEELEEARAALQEASKKRSRDKENLDGLWAELHSSRTEQQRADESLDGLRAELRSSRTEQQRADEELDGLRAELHSSRAELHSSRTEHQRADDNLDGLRAELHSSRTEQQRAKENLDGLRAEVHSSRTEQQRANEELEEARAALQEASKKRSQDEENLDGLRAELRNANDEMVAKRRCIEELVRQTRVLEDRCSVLEQDPERHSHAEFPPLMSVLLALTVVSSDSPASQRSCE
ncbi:unnamed protein product [Cylindrotheca closterium]|uniref:Uncharacterized protein n=1 Tax=Cylindrotheca closterium TaxID=2856 RepID=A0AAD2FK48_9STRA|nr:unnamed protein product [Cylindrotheca closterium]